MLTNEFMAGVVADERRKELIREAEGRRTRDQIRKRRSK